MPETDSMITVLLKLFDTLKGAIDGTNDSFEKLKTTVQDCIHKIELLPIEEIRKNISNHSKESSENSNKCNLTITTSTNTIETKLNNIENKIKNMIIVVITAVSLFGIALFIANFYMKAPTNRLETTIEQLQKTIEDERTKTDQIIEEQAKQIQELHDVINKMHTP